jgi:hypothetical protein
MRSTVNPLVLSKAPRGFLLVFFLYSSLSLLAGCASVSGDIGVVLQSVVKGRQLPMLPTFEAGLDARYRYLYVMPQNGLAAILVLGFERQTPQGLLEGWYSRDGASITTLDGRLSAVRGYTIEWAQSTWRNQPEGLVRMRDVRTAYTYGVSDAIRPQPVTSRSVPPALLALLKANGQDPLHFSWHTEQPHTTPASHALPMAWFASGSHRGQQGVVYSHQCMALDYCFDLARWPLSEARAHP